MTQTKTNEVLSISIHQLTCKFETIASHQKAMDTQIAQITQQVSYQGHLLDQPEINPRGHINTLFAVGERLEESPVMILHETVSVPDSTGTDERKEDESLSSNEKVSPSPPICPYQPPAPFPQRFLNMLSRIYADTPFSEALKKVKRRTFHPA